MPSHHPKKVRQRRQASRRKALGVSLLSDPGVSSLAASSLDVGKDGRGPLAIAALGASAGGLEAFQAFLDAMPAKSGLAFVIIQHLAHESASMLPELLARHTAMPVHTTEDGMTMAADHLYVMPPDTYLGIRAGKLHLEGIPEKVSVQLPIDHFFESLALDKGNRAIAIVLSGTGSDGSRGLQVLKEHGGMVLVQDPETAGQDGMPASAIRTGHVDQILPVQKIPERLLQYVRSLAADEASPPDAAKAALEAILELVRERTNYDFHCYKKGTLIRRILRRMGLRGLGTSSEYLTALQSDPDELQRLTKDLMIGVTRFFRDAEAYQVLAEKVFQQLILQANPNTTLRIWAAGCSSGEEPYSLAMMLSEQIAQAQKPLDFKIFASDIDREALDIARRGEYPMGIEADVGAERLERFFLRRNDSYQVRQDLRETIVFAEQNLLNDPPFSKLDLIVCRNLLIYLEPSVQARVIALFHYVLNDRGFLWLGSSESVGEHSDRFLPLSKKWRVFQRVGKRRGAMPTTPIVVAGTHAALGRTSQPPAKPAVTLANRVQKQLLASYAPAAVLVGDRFEVLYLHGPTGKYLNPPSGMVPFDLMEMCPKGLRHQVRMAVGRVRRDMQAETVLGGHVVRNGSHQTVKVSAVPLEGPDHPAAVLIIFEDDRELPDQGEPSELKGSDPLIIRRLEQELKTTQEDLNDTIEALENANRELVLANEEANSLNEEGQAINEELQSTNEELETSREELQSLNEELTSVNGQLNEKLQELEGTNNDLVNLLASTDMATIFLDLSLRIRRFTPATRELLSLLPTDQGRPIGDFSRKFSDDQLLDDAQRVLDHLQPIEKEIMSSEGRWYLRRIVPYHTTSHQIDGVVLTFTEISRQKTIEAALRDAHEQLLKLNLVTEGKMVERTTALASATQDLQASSVELAAQKELLETIIDHAPVGIAYYDSDLTIRWANPLLAHMFGRPLERVIHSKVSEAFLTLSEPILTQLNKVLERGVPVEAQGMAFPAPAGSEAPLRYLDMMCVPVHDPQGQVVGIIGMVLDVSERVEKERLQEIQIEKLREVDRLKNDFLNAASHELRTPLSSITGYAEFLEDEMGGPLTEEQSQYVAEIQRGGRRLQHLVDDLLDFARLEAGTFKLACQETDLRRLLETEVASLRPQAEEGNLTLSVTLPDGPQPIVLDAPRIGQVILNVVGNAIKFTPPGGRVEVVLMRQQDEMRIEVRDTGPGIAAAHLPRLFERFFQVDPSLTRSHGGTGLGLAISKSIVEAHGGTIGVDSSPGHGAIFWFNLPDREVPPCRSTD